MVSENELREIQKLVHEGKTGQVLIYVENLISGLLREGHEEGHREGWQEGWDEGYAEGWDEGYVAGQESNYD